jgi:hypothetical protein
MNRKLLVVAALVLAIGIAVLFVLPAYDVLPTAMRAWRAAKMLTLAMTTLVLLSIVASLIQIYAVGDAPDSISLCSDILELTCSRLC